MNERIKKSNINSLSTKKITEKEEISLIDIASISNHHIQIHAAKLLHMKATKATFQQAFVKDVRKNIHVDQNKEMS